MSKLQISTFIRRKMDHMWNRSGKLILTFDDWNDADPYIATRTGAYLQSEGITAVFFLINQKAQDYPDIIETLRQQGHYVASHSYSHARLTELSDEDLENEILRGINCNALRPPYSAWDARVYKAAQRLGYRLMLWTISTGDWREDEDGFRSVELIREAVLVADPSKKDNGVIIGHLHTNYPAAIPGIIEDMRAKGREFYPNKGPVGVDLPAEFI